MADVEIVTLKPKQWQEYKALRLRALKEDPKAFGSTYEEATNKPDKEWRYRLEKANKLNNYWMFFAKLDEELVGMVGARETIPPDTLPTIKINGLYVASRARGKGIGKKLMLHLLKEVVRNPRWKKVKIKVFPTQEIAINLYKSLGFEVIEKVTEDFPSGIKRETFVMEKSLINP